ncbi:ABC transporter permease [Kordiimonas gwangyangensis]|uniref:ABC transporter permease n=1 Tax=Kordiimonas gwangyangensis TaxID=288022 RepID=UPI000370905E|nr:ABC transporter permease [Kordiimonas gwangyangensis]
MFENYFLTAIRSIGKNRLFSAINIFGLAVGLMAALLILLYARFELSYDQFWKNSDRLYRVDMTFRTGSNPLAKENFVSGRVQDAYLSYFGDKIEAATRLRYLGATVRQDADARGETLTWADPDTLKIFQFDVIKGDLERAFEDKSSLAVSEKFAERWFKGADPIGKVLTVSTFNLKRDYQIVALYRDLPENSMVSDLEALALMDEEAFAEPQWLLRNWGSTSVAQFLLLKDGVDVGEINAQTPAMLDKFIEVPSGTGSDHYAYSASLFGDFYSHWVSFDEMSTARKVYVLLAIAVVLVLIGAINFVNLATARAIRRTREVALRKVLGARRPQLIVQFLLESYIITILAILMAIVFLELALPYFSSFLDKPLAINYADPVYWGVLGTIVIFVGGLAGFYPAFAISGSRPGRILLANKSSESRGAVFLRQVLVTFQFAISITLIVAAIVIYFQTWYVLHLDPGYDRENLLVVEGINRPEMEARMIPFREAVSRLPEVKALTISSETPSDGNNNFTSIGLTTNPADHMVIGELWLDDNFFDVYGIPVIAGRAFDESIEGDLHIKGRQEMEVLPELRMMINENAVYRFGFASPQDAVDQVVYWYDKTPIRIIGVVADARTQSLTSPQGPESYRLFAEYGSSLTVRYTGSPSNLIEKLERTWKEFAPFTPLVYSFVDEASANEFEQEVHMSAVLSFFSMLAVVIACMGLYGLAAFTAERRTKEIGIRKVMGASVTDIVRLLVWQFSKPVLVANLIAWPIAITAMLAWLESFPYRIDTWILLPLCIVAGAIALTIAWVTVGGNAARVARSNPVEALRYE